MKELGIAPCPVEGCTALLPVVIYSSPGSREIPPECEIEPEYPDCWKCATTFDEDLLLAIEAHAVALSESEP